MKKAVPLSTVYVLKNGILIPLRSNPIKWRSMKSSGIKKTKSTKEILQESVNKSSNEVNEETCKTSKAE